jgi:fibronectin-binding autotransporter adhesin
LQLLRQNNAANAPTNMVFSMVSGGSSTNFNWRFIRPVIPTDISAPAAVVNLQAFAGNQIVSLTWNASAAPDFWRYSVYRSTTNGGSYSLIASNLTATNLADNAVTNGTAYYYVVTATDLIGSESANSNQAIATPISPLPPTPTNLVHSLSNGMFVLNWPTNYTGWLLEVQTNNLSQGLGTNWATIFSSSNSSSFVIPMEAANPAVFYRLKLP